MAVVYCIFCKSHKEALKLGKAFGPILGDSPSDEGCELAADAVRKMRARLESAPDIGDESREECEAVLAEAEKFIERHRGCRLSACDNMFDYPWSIPPNLRRRMPRLVHMPGWIIKDARERIREERGREKIGV
jgi:hypothetical protein